MGATGKLLGEDFQPGYIFRNGLVFLGRAMGRRALHAEGQVRTKAGGVKCTGVQGTRMSACLKSPVIPLFFFSFTFIAKTLSLVIVNILFWMLKRTSVVFLFLHHCFNLPLPRALWIPLTREKSCIRECPKEKHRDESFTA